MYDNVHGITIPNQHQTLGFTRKTLPQLGPVDKFVENLKKHNIKHHQIVVDPHRLRPSQSEFKFDNIAAIMKKQFHTQSNIVISKDLYVIDGHHRWAAAANKNHNIKVIQVDMPALEIIQMAKAFNTTSYKSMHEAVRSAVQEALKRR